jgi:hypothetical protein
MKGAKTMNKKITKLLMTIIGVSFFGLMMGCADTKLLNPPTSSDTNGVFGQVVVIHNNHTSSSLSGLTVRLLDADNFEVDTVYTYDGVFSFKDLEFKEYKIVALIKVEGVVYSSGFREFDLETADINTLFLREPVEILVPAKS